MTSRRAAHLSWIRSTAVLSAVAALGGAPLQASAENWPVYITGSQKFQHESNLFRRETDPESDNQSITEVTLGLDKNYGRQNYQLSLTGSMNRFEKNDQLNNNGFSLNGGFTTTVGNDLWLTAGFGRSRALASFDNGTERSTQKNIRDASSYALSGRYGMYGKISIGATATRMEQDYTATSGIYPQQSSNSYGMDVRYTPSDLLNFGVGFRHSPGSTSYGESVGSSELDYETKTNNVDFTTSWRVTGLSALSARLSYTTQDRESSIPGSTLLETGYKGWTGSLDWQYRPRGRLTYSLRASRDTSNNASLSDAGRVTIDLVNDVTTKLPDTNETGDTRVNTAFGAGVDWEATSKIRIGADASLTYLKTRRTLKQNRVDQVVYAPTDEQTGKFSTIGVNATYAAQRWLSFNCGIQYLKRTADLFTEAYKDTVVNCSASATLNAQN